MNGVRKNPEILVVFVLLAYRAILAQRASIITTLRDVQLSLYIEFTH